MGEERLWNSLLCGFGRHSHRDDDRDLLRQKCENLNEAAGKL